MSTHLPVSPQKHVRFGRSLLAVAGWLRERLNEPMSLDELWTRVERDRAQASIGRTSWLDALRFEDVSHGVLLLYSIGELERVGDDRVRRKPL